jgi:hypothetical protein
MIDCCEYCYIILAAALLILFLSFLVYLGVFKNVTVYDQLVGPYNYVFVEY